MEASYFFQGLAIGFCVAAPIGPIGVLCIRRTLADGSRVGFVSGLGAATADASYSALAGFGLTAVSGLLLQYRPWFALLGGILLCYLGVRIFFSKPTESGAVARGNSLLGAYLSTLGLTLTNVTTIFSFVAIFAGLGIGLSSNYGAAGALVSGVFLGSTLWWFILSYGVGRLRARMNFAWLRTVNRVAGVALFLFGLFALSRW